MRPVHGPCISIRVFNGVHMGLRLTKPHQDADTPARGLATLSQAERADDAACPRTVHLHPRLQWSGLTTFPLARHQNNLCGNARAPCYTLETLRQLQLAVALSLKQRSSLSSALLIHH